MSRGPDKQFDPDVALLRAMDVFWEKGYEAVSLTELLKRMGIGRKSLYDTFGNKRSLFLKALECYARTELKAIRDRLAAPGSALANLEAVLLRLQQIHALPGSKGCMIGTNITDFCTDDKEMASILRGYLTQLEDAYCTTITRAQTAGELSPTLNARSLAQLLLCTTQGMALTGRVFDNGAMLYGAANTLMALLKKE